jgi:hypothetical protein
MRGGEPGQGDRHDVFAEAEADFESGSGEGVTATHRSFSAVRGECDQSAESVACGSAHPDVGRGKSAHRDFQSYAYCMQALSIVHTCK